MPPKRGADGAVKPTKEKQLFQGFRVVFFYKASHLKAKRRLLGWRRCCAAAKRLPACCTRCRSLFKHAGLISHPPAHADHAAAAAAAGRAAGAGAGAGPRWHHARCVRPRHDSGRGGGTAQELQRVRPHVPCCSELEGLLWAASLIRLSHSKAPRCTQGGLLAAPDRPAPQPPSAPTGWPSSLLLRPPAGRWLPVLWRAYCCPRVCPL